MADYGLPQQWAEYLEKRAVTPDQARERGYRTVISGKADGSGMFAADYGHVGADGVFHSFPRSASGLLIPLHSVLQDGGYQLRLDKPDAKGRKFLTPATQGNVLATAPSTRERLREGRGALFIVEGVTRVDALAAFGIPAVGMTGIWSWRGGLTTLPDFESLALKGANVVLVPDGDVRTRDGVNAAARRVKAWLEGKGANNVAVLGLPADQGLDDYIAAGRFRDYAAFADALRPLYLDQIEPPPPAAPGDVFAVDDGGPWACTPVADARRLVDYAPHQLCAVATSGTWRLLRVQTGGRWTESEDVLGRLHIEATLDWQRRVTEAAVAGRISTAQAQACTRWAVVSGRPAGLRDMVAMLGPAVLYMETHGILPPSPHAMRRSGPRRRPASPRGAERRGRLANGRAARRRARALQVRHTDDARCLRQERPA